MSEQFHRIHEFISRESINSEPTDEFINDLNKIVPDNLYVLYDARSDYAGYYVLEYVELSDYDEV